MRHALRRRYGHAVRVRYREAGPLQRAGWVITSGRHSHIVTRTEGGAKKMAAIMRADQAGELTSNERSRMISDVFDWEAGR